MQTRCLSAALAGFLSSVHAAEQCGSHPEKGWEPCQPGCFGFPEKHFAPDNHADSGWYWHDAEVTLRTGQKAPDWTLKSRLGEEHNLYKDHLGKGMPVVVQFVSYT